MKHLSICSSIKFLQMHFFILNGTSLQDVLKGYVRIYVVTFFLVLVGRGRPCNSDAQEKLYTHARLLPTS